MKTNNDEFEFGIWMSQVSDVVLDVLGVSTDDIPDQPYRDWFDDGLSATQAAMAAIEEELNS